MSDRAGSILGGLLAPVMRRLDYLALYPARVVAQNSDGTLELKPDDEMLPGMSRVPIRYGVPGVEASGLAGLRVLLGFEGGSPERPMACLWELGQADLKLNGGTQLVAREGDSVEVSIPAMTVVVAVVSGAGTMNPAPIKLTGTITSGAPRVKA